MTHVTQNKGVVEALIAGIPDSTNEYFLNQSGYLSMNA